MRSSQIVLELLKEMSGVPGCVKLLLRAWQMIRPTSLMS